MAIPNEGKMDFEVLRQLLGNEIDEREEKYGLNWHSTVVFRDDGFEDDVTKINLVAILKQHGLGNVRSL